MCVAASDDAPPAHRPPFDFSASLPAFLDSAPDAMVIVGPDGRIQLINRQAQTLFGYLPAELVGEPVEVLIPLRYRRAHPGFRDGYAGEPRIRPMGTGRDLHALRKDGTEFPAEISLGPIATAGGVFVTAAVRDLTERLRLAEESRAARRAIEVADELKASLREREILLQEVHHRVKNNLQVISSLINMQRRKVDDEAARLALLECQTRVQAIGLIHEQLYMYADYARVPFSVYVQGLVANLAEALGTPARVRVNLHVEPVALAVDKAIPCGLIVNELVTNAFKHAFPGDRAGAISVYLQALDDRRLELSVADDGVGMSAASGATAGRGRGSLGMQLVHTLVAQLGGTLTTGSGAGTVHTVHFSPEVS